MENELMIISLLVVLIWVYNTSTNIH
jgi:hypothetical protein